MKTFFNKYDKTYGKKNIKIIKSNTKENKNEIKNNKIINKNQIEKEIKLENINNNRIENNLITSKKVSKNKLDFGEKIYYTGIKKIEYTIKKDLLKYKEEKVYNKKIKINYKNNIYDKNISKELKKNEKINKLKKEINMKKMEECSFNPNINKKSKKRKSTNDTFNLLYSYNDIKLKKIKENENKIDLNCTFKPKINSSKTFEDNDIIKLSFFERNNKLIENKKEKENKINYINYNIYADMTKRRNTELLKNRNRSENIFEELYCYKDYYKNKHLEKTKNIEYNMKKQASKKKTNNKTDNIIQTKKINNIKKIYNELKNNNFKIDNIINEYKYIIENLKEYFNNEEIFIENFIKLINNDTNITVKNIYMNNLAKSSVLLNISKKFNKSYNSNLFKSDKNNLKSLRVTKRLYNHINPLI